MSPQPATCLGEGFADVNGTRLRYEVSGAGEPVVLVHGYTLDLRMWEAQVPSLSAAHAVVRYDVRGYGRSALPTGASYAHHDDFRALLGHLGIARAHVVGLSLGAVYAIDFALSHPDAVSSLVLVAPSGLGGFPWPDELARWFSGIHAAAAAGDLALAKRRWLETGWFTHARAIPAVARRLEEIVADYSGWHFRNPDPAIRPAPPAIHRLDEIRAPTLVVAGALDLPFYNRPLADHLAQRIPGARQVVMPGVGHMANMEAPDRFNEIVLSFLGSLRPAG